MSDDFLPLTSDANDQTSFEEEIQRSYLDYAMSVIISRALPDVRDGLKPVQRRILYAMNESGLTASRPFRKSSRVVGDVMSKYHPHGNQPIYDAMARMAQPFALRLPLIDGQGNFGSVDGDPPAAMRYTEARMARVSEALVQDIEEDTVDLRPNYDESLQEPVVLPTVFPNLLVNGSQGIAVGMATSIPPHNLGEIIDACLMVLNDHEATDDDILDLVPGPDFPTGAVILGPYRARRAMQTGRGSVIVRSCCEIEEIGGRERIVATEIPFMLNKSRLIERIAEVARDGVVEGISDLRDESNRQGIRVVVDIKRSAMAQVVLNNLMRHTPLQTSVSYNILAIDRGRPRSMSVPQVIRRFLTFRDEVVIRRSRFRLTQALRRAHILAGLMTATHNLDAVIQTIRTSADGKEAAQRLISTPWPCVDIAPFLRKIDDLDPQAALETVTLTPIQARAILDLRLQRLTAFDRSQIEQEGQQVLDRIDQMNNLLTSQEARRLVIQDELTGMRQRFATPRLTSIEESPDELTDEDYIKSEDVVVTISSTGYAKRTDLRIYRTQRRGGKGRLGMSTKDDDAVEHVLIANTHSNLLFFSSSGIVYALRAHRLPQGNPQARGRSLVNLLPLSDGEAITAVLSLDQKHSQNSEGDGHLIFATAKGSVRRNAMSDFEHINQRGKIAIKLPDGDQLVAVRLCPSPSTTDILLSTREGQTNRFLVHGVHADGTPVDGSVRLFKGRSSKGVRGITLSPTDQVVSMELVPHHEHSSEQCAEYLQAVNARRRLDSLMSSADSDSSSAISGMSSIDRTRLARLNQEPYRTMVQQDRWLLSVSQTGLGMLTSQFHYRITKRGGKGVRNMDLGNDDHVVSTRMVGSNDAMIVSSAQGQTIRIPVQGVRMVGRSSRGVKLVVLQKGDTVASVARVIDDNIINGDSDLMEVSPLQQSESPLQDHPSDPSDPSDASDPLLN